MLRKNTFRFVFLGLLAFIAWTCNTTAAGDDTLDYNVNDSLKYPNYDSLHISVFVVSPITKDTTYRKLVFHNRYTDKAQLLKMNIGKLPSIDFVVVLVGFKNGVRALITALNFVNGKPGKLDTIRLPSDTTHRVNHRPILNLAGVDSGKTSFAIKEGNTLSFTLAVRDTDAGDAAGLQSLTGTYCGIAALDTVTKFFSFNPAYSCADTSTDSLVYNVKFMTKDRGNPPLWDTLGIRIVVLDSIRALDVVINSPPNGYVTRDTVVAVRWSVNGVVQTTQASEPLKIEGLNGIKRVYRDTAIGNSAFDSVTVTRDTKAPNKPLVTGPGLTKNQEPTWTWRSGGNGGAGMYRFKLDDKTLTDTVGVVDTSFTPATNLTEGVHKLYVQERDAAGNWSVMDSSAIARVDITAPVVTIQTPSDSLVTNRDSVLVTWKVGGVSQTAVKKALVEGVNTITQSSTDSAGNVGTISVTVTRRSNVIFVNAAVAAGGDGNTWGTAYKYLQTALAAATSGKELWVAKGIYKPASGIVGVDTNTFDTSFVMKSGVNMYGGFAGRENDKTKRDWVKNESVMSGERGNPVDSSDNLGMIVVGANNTTLDGLVVEKAFSIF